VASGNHRAEVGRQFRTLFHLGAIGDLSDGQLLERFATGRGEGAELAFSAIVERHGSMVLRVCRSVLDDPHASEDAFQATFLVLVAKGRSLWVRDSLGPWLHQVATRTARCARASAARRRRLEQAATLQKAVAENQAEPTDEIERVLLEEIHRLPERFQAPVILCDLEGQSHEAAARALGWPIGTVKSRQARARERLRDRLTRRGFAPSHSLALLALPRFGATIPAFLVNSTAVLAIRFVATRGIAPGSAAWLAQEVIRSMSILRSMKIATVLLALGAAGSGAGYIAQQSGEEAKKKAEVQVPAKPKPAEKSPTPEPPDDKSVFQVKPGKLEVTESATGHLEPSKSVNVQAKINVSRKIHQIKPDGSEVRKGEVIGVFESEDLKQRLENQKITVEQAEAEFKQAGLVREVADFAVKEFLEGIFPAEQTRMKAKVADAERGLKDGEARLERTREARKRLDHILSLGIKTSSDVVADLNINDLLEAAGRNLSDQKQALDLAKEQLVQFEKFTVEMRTRKLQIDVEQAKHDEFAKKTAWEGHKSNLTHLELQIENCKLVAPADGTLTYATADELRLANEGEMREGAVVQANSIVARVIDLDAPMLVTVKVREAMVDQIQPGQKTRVTLNALKGLTFDGTVLDVAPRLDKPTYQATQQKLYITRIKLDQALPRQRPGMSARATIVIRELDNVLSIPIACVDQFEPSVGQVNVKTSPTTLEARRVTLGASNDEFIEIKSGLKAGDVVSAIYSGGFQ
jgi:RNA polymerase sigma factor (sigma-70 family)